MDFSNNQKEEEGRNGKGESHPPKKQRAVTKDSQIMLEYSAKKNSANAMPEYSTLYPATISASASGRSKGALFVSASTDIKNTMLTGSNGTTNHTCSCCWTISTRLKELAQAATGKSNKDIDTS